MPTILGLAALFLLATDALQLWISVFCRECRPRTSSSTCIAVVLALRMVDRAQRSCVGHGSDAGRVHRADRLRDRHVARRRTAHQLSSTMTCVASGIKLKSGLIDHYIFFLVFLFGVQTPEDAMKVIKWPAARRAASPTSSPSSTPLGVISLGFRIRVRRPHRGRDRRIESVRRVHHSVPAGDHRGCRGAARIPAACSGSAPRWSRCDDAGR